MRRAVITGMGVVSPNGIGREAFSAAVLAGKSGVKRISRFDASWLPAQVAGEITDFDESKWISAMERKHVSRAIPLAVAATDEACKEAGLDYGAMSMDEKRQIGMILGSGGGAQEFSEEQYRLYYTGHLKQVSIFSIPSGTMGTLSSEVSMKFGFRGPSHMITTACTSSTDAIGYALQNIQLGILPMYICGGVDVPIAPAIVKTYTMLHALTTHWNDEPERASRPFSADRSGFVLAEGAWTFVLEEYEHAKARGAKILAEVAGYGTTCEAFHRVRLREDAEEPARAVTLAMQEAGVTPEQIDYVNLHGTSTEMNDPVETLALKLALGEKRAYQVPMSALKSQIGHAQGACGAAGLAATLVAMETGQIPPTINLDVPDPRCDLDYVTDIGRKAEIRTAICNCVGFGSKNSALVVRRVE